MDSSINVFRWNKPKQNLFRHSILLNRIESILEISQQSKARWNMPHENEKTPTKLGRFDRPRRLIEKLSLLSRKLVYGVVKVSRLPNGSPTKSNSRLIDQVFFCKVASLIDVLPDAARSKVMCHLDYLSVKANVGPSLILSGGDYFVDTVTIIDDTKLNIGEVIIDELIENNDEIFADSSYFFDLNQKLTDFDIITQGEVLKHIDYLADKSSISSANILAGVQFKSKSKLLREAKKNIDFIFDSRIKMPKALDPSFDDYLLTTIDLAERRLQGWCNHEKALKIASIIETEKPDICVEIGVFGGRSLIPAAAALKRNGTGVIYGIETWRPDIATEYVTDSENDSWWQNIDYRQIKMQFFQFVIDNDLTQQIRIIEAPSAQCASIFEKVDYLHIDGAHSIYNAAEDVVLFAKKVKVGGIIVIDDVDWPTTIPAVAILDAIGDREIIFTGDKGDIAGIVYRRCR